MCKLCSGGLSLDSLYSHEFDIFWTLLMDCSLVLMVTHDPPVKVEQECDALLPGPPCPPQARSPDCVWTYLHAHCTGWNVWKYMKDEHMNIWVFWLFMPRIGQGRQCAPASSVLKKNLYSRQILHIGSFVRNDLSTAYNNGPRLSRL